MSWLRRLACAVPVCLLLVVGCQKLAYEKTEALDPGIPFTATFDSPRYGQKLTVTVSSTKAPVSAYVVKESDLKAAESALDHGKPPPNPLGAQENAANINLTATVPAKTSFSVVVVSKRGTEVKIKVVGR